MAFDTSLRNKKEVLGPSLGKAGFARRGATECPYRHVEGLGAHWEASRVTCRTSCEGLHGLRVQLPKYDGTRSHRSHHIGIIFRT